MDAFTTYSFGTASWLALQAAPLIIAPKVIIAMLSPEMHETSTLEIYLSRSLGLGLLTLAITSLLFTGIIPLTSSLSTSAQPDPYASPAVTVTMLYHSAVGFYCYMLWSQTGYSGFMLGLVASAALGGMGLWAVMFATEGHVSRRTGKDKRVSGFPFKSGVKDEARGKKKEF